MIYPYLQELQESVKKGTHPAIVDCLNCEKGCNGGTGTNHRKTALDTIEFKVHSRAENLIKLNKRKVKGNTDKFWVKNLFSRKYKDRSSVVDIKIPTEQEKWDIYHKMHKQSERDIFNCTACGYHNCADMAKAIYNNLNKPENCYHYKIDLIEKGKEKLSHVAGCIKKTINESVKEVRTIDRMVESLQFQTTNQTSAIEETTAAAEQMIASIQSINRLLHDRKDLLTQLQHQAEEKIGGLRSTVDSIHQVVQSVGKVQGFNTTINNVAQNTNLLAMNAAIEAAHAGDKGRGFSVVASEIRKLAEESSQNAQNINIDLKTIINDIDTAKIVSTSSSEEMKGIIAQFSPIAGSLEELSQSMEEMTMGTEQIQEAMDGMVQSSQEINQYSIEINDVMKKLILFYQDLRSFCQEGANTLSD